MAASPFSSHKASKGLDFSRSKGWTGEMIGKRQGSVASIDENKVVANGLEDYQGIDERSVSGSLSLYSSRAQSLGDVEFGLERANSSSFRLAALPDTSLFDTNMSLESCATVSGKPSQSGAVQKWQRSLHLVEKGLAFNKAFKALSSQQEENVIDASRLTKIKEVGSGAFATVELCNLKSKEPGQPDIPVAVKRLRPEFLRSRKDLERFFNEAELLRKLDHRAIAKYVGVGNLSKLSREDIATITAKEARQMLKSTYIVQEYIDGGSFKSLLLDQMMKKKSAAYKDVQACAWMRQVADGLLYLHSSNPKVIHRDLKLENILLKEVTGGKEACLVDFGMSSLLPFSPLRKDSASSMRNGRLKPASIAEEGGETWRAMSLDIDQSLREALLNPEVSLEALHIDQNAAHDLTGRTGSYMYMAPEVYNGQHYNEKADVFSFACVLYEVFSRFIVSTVVVGPSGDPAAAQVYANKIAKGYRRPFPKSLQGSPIAELISDCWQDDPKSRPSMAEIVTRLQTIEQGIEIKGGRQSMGRSSSKQLSEDVKRRSHDIGASPTSTLERRTSSGCFACFGP